MLRDFPSRAEDENPYFRGDSNIGSDSDSDSDRDLHGTRHVQNSVEKVSNLVNLRNKSGQDITQLFLSSKKPHQPVSPRQLLHRL